MTHRNTKISLWFTDACEQIHKHILVMISIFTFSSGVITQITEPHLATKFKMCADKGTLFHKLSRRSYGYVYLFPTPSHRLDHLKVHNSIGARIPLS